MEIKKSVYNAKDVATVLDISIPGAYVLMGRSDFPSLRIGERRIIVPISAFEKWLDAQAGQKQASQGR